MSHSDNNISLCQFIMDQYTIEMYDKYGDEYPREDKTFIAVVGAGIAGASMVSYIATNLWLEAVVSVVRGSSEQNNANSQVASTYLYDAINNMVMLFVVGDLGDAASTTTILDATKNAEQHVYWTIGVFTLPATFADEEEITTINATLARLRETFNTVIIIPQSTLEQFASGYTDYNNSLQLPNTVCFLAVRALCEGLMRKGLICLDGSDFSYLMSEHPIALFGVGIFSGSQDEVQVVQEVISCPLLCNSFTSADRVFIHLRCDDQCVDPLGLTSNVMHNVQDKMGLNEYDPERLLFQLTCVEEVSELIISLVAMFEDVPTITLDGKLFFRKEAACNHSFQYV